MADLDTEAHMRLVEISKILGVSVDEFKARNIPAELLATDECLRLWSRLKTARGREQALEALRRVADDEAA